MDAMMVQAKGGLKYGKTTDPRRMMTHALLNEAIRKDWCAIRAFLPARTATYIRYEKGAKNAVAWDEGGTETKILLPLETGWYVPDGNLFAIPNGKPSNSNDPDALYLVRHQDREYGSPLGRGNGWLGSCVGRYVDASGDWSGTWGVALVNGRDVTAASGSSVPIVQGVEQSTLQRRFLHLLRATGHQIGDFYDP